MIDGGPIHRHATGMEPVPLLTTVLSKLRTLGVELPAGPVRLDGYGDSQALSEELLALIREGHKRAGTSLLWTLEAESSTQSEYREKYREHGGGFFSVFSAVDLGNFLCVEDQR